MMSAASSAKRRLGWSARSGPSRSRIRLSIHDVIVSEHAGGLGVDGHTLQLTPKVDQPGLKRS